MGKHWHDLASWWTRHPSWQAFIYFLICAILALFTDRVKSVITAPVRVSWNWLSIRAEKSVRNDLAVIKWVHNNPYNLLLYLAESAVDAVVWSAFISLAVNAYSIGLALFFHSSVISQMNAYSGFFGGIIGRAFMLRRVLRYLYDYDSSVRELEKSVGKA